MNRKFKIISLLGSLRIAIILILVMATVLTIATFYESFYGTAAAQYSIYKTIWFSFLLFLIAMSVTCGALKKYPWKMHQIGFVVTHIGIVTLIIGSFVSFQWGIDAQMLLSQGEEKNFFLENERMISLSTEKGQEIFPLNVGPYPTQKTLATFQIEPDLVMVADRFLPFADVVEEVVPDPTSPHPAISLALKGNFADIHQWMVLNGKETRVSFGPAEVVVKSLDSEKDKNQFLSTKESAKFIGTLLLKSPHGDYQVQLTKDNIRRPIRIPNTAFQLSDISYFTDARVENNRLINKSSTLQNPAVRLTLTGPNGSETHVAFSSFPNFPSTHHETSLYGAKIEFHSSLEKKGMLMIGITPHKKLFYRVSSSKGVRMGSLDIGKSYETGWMNSKFVVQSFLPYARKITNCRQVLVKDPNNPQVPSALRVKFTKRDGSLLLEEWLLFSEEKHLSFLGKDYRVAFESRMKSIPFSIRLKEFRMGTDPGTQNPAFYQSDVILKDEVSGTTLERRIEMNEPLTYSSSCSASFLSFFLSSSASPGSSFSPPEISLVLFPGISNSIPEINSTE